MSGELPSTPSSRTPIPGVRLVVVAAVLLLSACQGSGAAPDQATGPGAEATPGSQQGSDPTSAPRARLLVQGGVRTDLPVDTQVVLQAEEGVLTSLTASSPQGEVPGEIAAQGREWRLTGRLEPGTTYRAIGVVNRPDGTTQQVRTSFGTSALTLDQQTYPSVAPLAGETVGVGMPVIVTFDVPVTDRVTFEEHMRVTSVPSQVGSWHWLSSREAHWRPREYWQPGSRVRVEVDVNSLPAGGGVYGQESRVVDFRVGDSVVSRVDVDTHRMNVFINGDLARSMPISAGKPGWETRSGVKVIIEKFRRKTMDAATIGVSEDDPEYYALSNVEYAMRVTYSGEFLHAAPWSTGSQGRANVSHGCVGMSTADAGWLYELTKRGDVVEVTGSSRQMTLTNGYGDWNVGFAEYRAGSALS